MKKMKWALIGCGNVILKNKKIPFINSKNEIVGICTTSIEHSKAAQQKLKIKNCICCDKLDDLLLCSPDAIYICTPPKYHYEYLMKLKDKNVIIYVEKPLTINEKENKIIFETYKNKKNLYIATYKRLTKQIKKVKKIIYKNKLGKITRVDGNFQRIFNKDLLYNSWFYDKEISGGGRFYDISPHILDSLYFIFSEFSNFSSNIMYSKQINNCEEKGSTQFYYKNIIFDLQFDFNSNKDIDQITIYGEKLYLIFSINRNPNIYIYQYDNLLLKKIKIRNKLPWGIEAINQIRKSENHLANINDAYIVQHYINLILKRD